MNKFLEKKFEGIKRAIEFTVSMPSNEDTEWLEGAKNLSNHLFGLGVSKDTDIDFERLGKIVYEAARYGAAKFDYDLINGKFINNDKE